jgi:hypothetical protein
MRCALHIGLLIICSPRGPRPSPEICGQESKKGAQDAAVRKQLMTATSTGTACALRKRLPTQAPKASASATNRLRGGRASANETLRRLAPVGPCARTAGTLQFNTRDCSLSLEHHSGGGGGTMGLRIHLPFAVVTAHHFSEPKAYRSSSCSGGASRPNCPNQTWPLWGRARDRRRHHRRPRHAGRKGFPSGANSDVSCVLDEGASMHGQAFIGRSESEGD